MFFKKNHVMEKIWLSFDNKELDLTNDKGHMSKGIWLVKG